MYKSILFVSIVFIIVALSLSSCDEGLAPRKLSEKAFLNGKIIFVGGKNTWPPADSVAAIRVAAFKKYPFENQDNIINELLSGNAYFTFQSLPMFVDTAEFSLEINDAPVEIKYFGVAQQYDTSITSEKVIGVYTESGDNTKPSSILIFNGHTYNIEIKVDFNNLPPQPFGSIKN